MLTSSSPIISAPPSPSTSFHSAQRSSYHASPRFTVTPASTAARRFDTLHSQSQSQAQSPSHSQSHSHAHTPTHAHPRSSFAHSPHALNALKRPHAYADAATQYTPPGFPPTYRPTDTAAPAPLDPPAIVDPLPSGGAAHPAPAVDLPAEPALRQDPSPVDHGPPLTQPTPRERPRALAAAAAAADDDVPASPAKRPRTLDPSLKVMPLKYETCDVKDLGVLVSDMLMELVRLNDGHPLHDGQLTRFHSRAPPGISVRDYLLRLIVHATLSPPILLSMVFYVDKLCTMYPSFTISSLTVHRFLITAATVAAKGLSDSFWTNTLYARVGGVSVRELALLELEFLRKLEWRIVPKPEVLVDYYKGLVERGTGYTMEAEPDASPASEERVQSPAGSATGIHTSQ